MMPFVLSYYIQSLLILWDKVVKDLSRGQKLLYQYIKAVSEGQVSLRLATQKVGPLNHSRWVTLAIRILQLYTRTENPSEGLR